MTDRDDRELLDGDGTLLEMLELEQERRQRERLFIAIDCELEAIEARTIEEPLDLRDLWGNQ